MDQADFRFWPFLIIFDHFWSFLTIFGRKSDFLTPHLIFRSWRFRWVWICFLLLFLTSCDTFKVFWIIFWFFRLLFESKNESEMVKMRQNRKSRRRALGHINQKNQPKPDYHISDHYTIVLHVSDTFSDYYRCFYDVSDHFLMFWTIFFVKNHQKIRKITKTTKQIQNSSKITQNHRKSHSWSLYNILTCGWYIFGLVSMVLRCFGAVFDVLYRFVCQKSSKNMKKPPNKHKILRKSLKSIENHISDHYTILLHVSDTFSD